jgi:hypothetical protein
MCLAAIKSFMHFLECRVPSALEQIRRMRVAPAFHVSWGRCIFSFPFRRGRSS